MKTIVNAENVSFDKLNDEQKEKAIDLIRERERESADNFFADSVIEDYKNDILPEYGIDDAVIYWSGFWSQGDGASISTDSVDIEKFLRKVKSLTKFRGIRKLFDLGEYSPLYASIERDKYSRYHHENTVSGYVETMYCGDLTAKQEDLADQLENLLTETIRDLSCKLYRDLESAYNDQFTDEAITESIEANDYRFDIDEDGKVYAIA